MKKHIFGFALFSFIVGTTGFIYAMLNIVNIEEVKVPSYTPSYSSTKSCWKMKRNSTQVNLGSPLVKQATFNLASKQLKWELDTSQINAPIALNFFIKNESGTQYVNSTFVPTIAFRDGSVNATSSYEWLNNLDSHENLYVIAEPLVHGKRGYKNSLPEFDASKATAVLVY
jgi:hypothetical protein